jgi:hypothetical protein
MESVWFSGGGEGVSGCLRLFGRGSRLLGQGQYLLEIEARGQLDLPEHIQALLGSMIPKP